LKECMPFTSIEWRPTGPGSGAAFLHRPLKHGLLIQSNNYPVKRQRVPPGHLALGRRTRVETLNGCVGHVEKLLIYPADGRIMRLAIRTGRLWNEEVTSVPLWRISRIGRDGVSLAADASTLAIPPTMSYAYDQSWGI
jgi:hypothetical protein